MDSSKNDKQKSKRLSFSNLKKTFTRTSNNTPDKSDCKCNEIEKDNELNRTHSIFKSIRRSFKKNKMKIFNTKKSTERIHCRAPTPPIIPPRRATLTNPGAPVNPDIEVLSNDQDHRNSSQYLDLSEINNENVDVNKSLGGEYFSLAKYGWYWGPITKQEAEDKLKGQEDGTFLIRDSASERYFFTLSFLSCGRVLHSRIEHLRGVYSLCQYKGASIAELIEKALDISEKRVFSYSRSRGIVEPAYPVRLIKPLSRLTQVRSLQYLCRFTIRQYINVNNIQKLPLPASVQVYLRQGHY